MNLGFILSFMGKYADKMIRESVFVPKMNKITVGIARLLMIQEI